MRTAQRLEKTFYERPTTTVAQELLGKVLVRRLESGVFLAGVVVEVEAYLPTDDPASHSFRGLGKKNASMFEPPGRLYVYPIHAKYCLNVVTESSGHGAAVLIRALQPLEGVAEITEHRGTSLATALTTGPARLCQALDVNRNLDGEDLIASTRIWFEKPPAMNPPDWQARTSSRIGISQATDLQLRWFIDGNRYVSGCARDHSRGRHWSFDF